MADGVECVTEAAGHGTVANSAMVPSAVLKPRAPAHVTVEVHDGPLPPPADPRQVPGEDFKEGEPGGYHYYPGPDQARDWPTATGFRTGDEQEADHYQHFLLHRR